MSDLSYEAVLKRHVKKEGDCIVWTGAVCKWGPHIEYRVYGKRAQAYPQRVALLKKYNLDPKKRYRYSTTCGNPRCLNEDHLVLHKDGELRVRNDYKKSVVHNIILNLSVFSEVKLGVTSIAKAYNIAPSAVYRIYKNTALFPYFQRCIESALPSGTSIADIRRENLSIREIKKKYGLSAFAAEYVARDYDYKVHNFDIYEHLLLNCSVHLDHLVWRKASCIDEARRNFMIAMFGEAKDAVYRCTCGVDSCVNPYHLAEVKND